MKIGSNVYYLDGSAIKTGIIVSKGWRWGAAPWPSFEYIVRDVTDVQTIGLVGTFTAALNGKPESLSHHSSSTIFKRIVITSEPAPEAEEESI